MLAIVVSEEDAASVHIGECLLELASWDERQDESRTPTAGGGTVYETDGACMRWFADKHLFLDRPAEAFDDATLVVFASKHAGDTGKLLTAHHPGNFGPADHGGRDNDLPAACPNAHARVVDALGRYAPEGYEVGMECTHHGPTDVGAPAMFVEVGSSKAQWEDPDAARAVANAILDLEGVSPYRPPAGEGDGDGATRRQLVGFGGGHYCPRFERVVRETDWAFGHIAADWGLDALGDLEDPNARAVLQQAFEQSQAHYALVDSDRPDVQAAVEAAGHRPVSETWVRETDGIALDLVRALEEAVQPVGDGLRFGESAVEHASETADGNWRKTALATELLDETFGIDRPATLAAVDQHCLAYATSEGGTRPTGEMVVTDPSDRERLVDRLLAVLAQRYDVVEREGDTVVATVEEFDPERARTLGVPEGPAFGRLADGETVEVGGEEIPPDVVQTERTRRFPICE